MATFIYIRQKSPLGLGHAVLCAEKLIKDEPFMVYSGDDIIDTPYPITTKLVKVFKKYKDIVIGIKEVPRKETQRYGIIKGKKISGRIYEVQEIVEKPSPSHAPSRLAVSGRWLLTPEIFFYLKKTKPDKSKEIQLTDALKLYLKERVLYAYNMEGEWYDCGKKIEFLKAVINFSLKRKEFRSILKRYLLNKIKK
jgi:UTP--glucose-1-phosphate uridylyltransferase